MGTLERGQGEAGGLDLADMWHCAKVEREAARIVDLRHETGIGQSRRIAMAETARASGLIFAIISGVLIYVHFLGFTGMPGAIANWILALDMPPTVVLIGILALYLVLGMFLDGIGMLLLTVPLILPTVKELGIHPIVFGVLVVRMVEIGLITPPVGLNVYVLRGVAPNISMTDMFKGCGWFVLVDLINVAILIAFPAIILTIPESMIK